MPDVRLLAIPGRHASRVAAGLLLAGGLLAACGGGSDPSSNSVEPPSATALPTWTGGPIPQASPLQAVWGQPLKRSMPTSLKISRLGVSAPVSALGLRSDGRIQEPPLSRPGLTGWYKEGPTPGEIGPAVVLGHVDANGRAAVFKRLKELRTGDLVEVTRKDGAMATFAVQSVVRVAKSSFPGQQVYAEDVDFPSLRLITCGGVFNPKTGHYVDNVIAFARLVSRGAQ